MEQSGDEVVGSKAQLEEYLLHVWQHHSLDLRFPREIEQGGKTFSVGFRKRPLSLARETNANYPYITYLTVQVPKIYTCSFTAAINCHAPFACPPGASSALSLTTHCRLHQKEPSYGNHPLTQARHNFQCLRINVRCKHNPLDCHQNCTPNEPLWYLKRRDSFKFMHGNPPAEVKVYTKNFVPLSPLVLGQFIDMFFSNILSTWYLFFLCPLRSI